MNCIDTNYGDRTVHVIEGSRYRDSYDEFKSLKKSYRKRIDLLRGHHFFGSHNFLRSGAVYFTMLREPISRVTSLYNYLLETNFYSRINEEKMTFASFLDSGLAMAADNGMTRMIAGADLEDVPYGMVSRSHVASAISLLEKHFVAVGLTEKFEASLELYCRTLDWKELPKYHSLNKTSQKVVSTDTAKVFFKENPDYQKYIDADIQLYSYAKRQFEDRVN